MTTVRREFISAPVIPKARHACRAAGGNLLPIRRKGKADEASRVGDYDTLLLQCKSVKRADFSIIVPGQPDARNQLSAIRCERQPHDESRKIRLVCEFVVSIQ